MIKYSTQLRQCSENGDTLPVEIKLKDNAGLAPCFPSKAFAKAMKDDPDFSITLLDCKKFGGRCSSRNEGCVKMRAAASPDYKEIKRSLVESLTKRGFQVPEGARFFYSSSKEKAGMMVGSYCRDSHIETIEFYALLDSCGELVGGSDFWWREI